MASVTLVSAALLPILMFALWHLTAMYAPPVPASMQNKRIILLIAHPDDESMFFNPTLQALTDPRLQNHLKILCMSTGDSGGLGATRKLELEKAAVTLGVRRREDVFVLDDDRFRDGMQENWQPEDIARVLASAFAPHLHAAPPAAVEKQSGKSKSRPTPTSRAKSVPEQPEGPHASIDILITFDEHGISYHPNHRALYHGARLFLTQIMKGHTGYACPVTLYTLPSINIFRKYSFILDIIPTLLQGILGVILGNATRTRGPGVKEGADRMVLVNTIPQYWTARDAMINGHSSQMVWFRWGWIALGRYMVVNDLRSERVTS